MLFKLQPVKSLNHLIGKFSANIPLKYVLILPFLLQICGTVGLVGYLSFENGQKAVKKLATELQNEICDRIEQNLDSYIATPKQINQINLDAIELGLLNLSDLQTTGHYFWKQMRVFNVSYNNFANTKGEFIGIERQDNGKLLINEVTKKHGIGKLYVYTTDNQGNRRQIQEIKNYDPRVEAWYTDAVQANKPVWSEIYQWEDKPEIISISSSYPVYDNTNKLIGVIGIDLVLSQINNFLVSLNPNHVGKTFILERSGLIVASSSNQPAYTVIDGQIKRQSGFNSQDSLIRVTTQYLLKRFGSLGFLVGRQQLSFTVDGVPYFVQVKNWRDDLGLDWLIVAVIPESNFMEQINANTSTTIMLCIAAFLVAITSGILTTRWIIKPILQLNKSAKKLAKGEWEETTKINRSDELGDLAKSFNIMAKQLQESFTALETKHTEMKVLNETLSASESRLIQFLEAIPVGVFIIDNQAKPYYINHIGQEILGQGIVPKATSEELPKIYRAYLAGTEQLYPSDRLPILRALQGEIARVDDMEIHRFDQIIPLETLAKPIYDELGNITFAIATFFDITQRQQAENVSAEYNRILEFQVQKRTEELLQVIEQLQTTQNELIESQKIAAQGQKVAEQANRAKSEFLTNMSHELRTPLNAILGFTQLMSQDDSLSSEQQENLLIINGAGEHLLNLINDILEMSKIEAGRITLNLSSFDLIYLLQNLEEMLRLRAASKNLQLVFEYTQNIPQYIETDENKLRQVLLNLLGNAIKFTDTGKVSLRVRLEEWEMGKQDPPDLPHLFFEVQDSGSGIASSEMDLLFRAFEQTETGRKSQQGTGLGLAISRKYVELMGGNITVSSISGIGSRFTFDIQISLACPRETHRTQIKYQIPELVSSGTNFRILVVDDARESRLLLVKILTSMGFEVEQATDGTEAIASWKSWQPHLIFMDMRMPVMDGYEATREIKQREQKSKATEKKKSPIPNLKSQNQNQKSIIIALTASAFEEERQKILSIGCDDFIRKPFTQQVLLEKLSHHLGVKYINQVSSKNQSVICEVTQMFASETEIQEHLSQMSPVWVEKVYLAAASCSDDLILELLKQIPPDKVQVFQVLTDLASNYQFEKIMALTRTNAE